MKLSQSRRQFKSRMAGKQDVWHAIPALMGDGNGVIEVPNQPGYVYIRVGDGDLGQAFNNRCPLADNLPIHVGYDPVIDPDRRIFQVLSVRMADYAGAGNTNLYANVPAHHATHEFGGGDDVFINWRRLMGFRVGRPSGFRVTVDSGYIIRAGAWLAVASQNLDLSALQPAGLLSCYVLIVLNGAGVATATAGADVAGLIDISDCPVPGAGEIPLAAVHLYGTQTAIGDTPTAPEIVDLRFPQASMAGIVHLEDLDGYARGRIIRGGAVDWEAYSLAGAAGSFLRRDALDVLWSTLTLPNAATTGDLLYASGANTIGNLADVAVGQVLASGGVGVAPAYSASPTLTGLTLSGLTASTVIYSNAGKAITSLANAAGYLSNDGAGALSWSATATPSAHAIDGASHTVAGRIAGQVLVATGAATFGWTPFKLAGILDGTLNLSIQTTETLFLSALTTASLDLGGTFAFGGGGASNNVTFPNAILNFTNGGTLNLAGFTLTVPATGTAVLGTGANTRVAYWSGPNTLTSDADFTFDGSQLALAVQGNTGGILCGGDVLFYRGGADLWQTPDSLTIDTGLNVGGAASAPAGAVYVKATSVSTSGIVRIESANRPATADTSHADLQFYDNGTLGFRFLAAFGNNPASSRYGGFIGYSDRDGTRLPLRFYTADTAGNPQLAITIGAGQVAGTAAPVTISGEIRVAGDIGGAASTNTLTGVSNVAANSTGVGTIKFKGTTSRDSTGFIKFYIGTTAYYVPVFSAITG